MSRRIASRAAAFFTRSPIPKHTSSSSRKGETRLKATRLGIPARAAIAMRVLNKMPRETRREELNRPFLLRDPLKGKPE